MATITSMTVLGHVAREGRLFLGESPEQVGGSIGVSGRTIRRLETAESTRRPRDITLRTLASYYGMSPDFFRWIARETATGKALEERLRHRAELAGLEPVEEPMVLALMLARHRPAARLTREEAELEVLQSDVAQLNDRRRRLVRQFVEELRLAQSEEIRRREDHAA
jgi:transcriptional regulator with XRE-family HTH domain